VLKYQVYACLFKLNPKIQYISNDTFLLHGQTFMRYEKLHSSFAKKIMS